jgi:hypothetical protein
MLREDSRLAVCTEPAEQQVDVIVQLAIPACGDESRTHSNAAEIESTVVSLVTSRDVGFER